MPTQTISYSSQAINAALFNNWKEAIKYNEEILGQNPEDIDALNRLAYAHLQLGKLKEAKKLYKKVINLDSYNQIAKKNLLKIGNGKNLLKDTHSATILHPSFFLEEPGRTKTISLINIAPFSLLSRLTIGKEVYLHPKKHTIEVRDLDKAYLGALPDDISYRLIRCLKSGNTYTIFVKNVSKNQLTIFIKELERNGKLRNQPSFVSELSDYQTSFHKENTPDEEDKETAESFS
ncbi:hypothetical protein A2773_02685 [Candidatus Gottesmanbacteria bacterium RIFCSPHIGHO2_01_FULL_39_10]|uniref:Uncharacterized protein n=1 Tax=Candidatus Gottesmanbacteria bacterium RIFCSPHIGHO2_01_FULL_39_10 TaxID=1798375 RepID=A0A1F5ZQQ3_9BACT|nr:MAG: hypothetical protein A2773_02685 [Candidatus Gottesmanbacteria bacterium RIFCSPHIGHO2_01_FULL_39_10]